MRSETPHESSRGSRDSIPPLLSRLQAWMESERLLHKVLPVTTDKPVRILRVRRNFKFRKLTVKAGSVRYICYLHYWPRGLRNMAWFSEQAQRAGVQVPQPLRSHTAWRHLLSNHSFSLVLPYAEGTPLSRRSSQAALETLGRSLGRLHGITGRRAGPLMSNFPNTAPYMTSLRNYWHRAARQLRKHADFASASEIDRATSWLADHGRFLADLKSFNLTHGDPAGGNFLMQGDAEICLIDCDRIGFEPAPMELANALLQGYCADDPDRRASLVEAWLSTCPAQARVLWEQQAQFFIAAALLWRTQRKLQWTLKRPDEGRSLERAKLAWQQLQQVIQTRPSSWETALTPLCERA